MMGTAMLNQGFQMIKKQINDLANLNENLQHNIQTLSNLKNK